ncbi:glycosyltransferase family 4 protein [Neorhizobium sp. NCHU2750]|uniref:glycosyltransferase family 4 protein n=1 Tax=Neorhizobium sp. NCHU2750 TaxID=1825976 RepID=UPI000EB63047|nr:glycosyltransferase [Neorhizobium sp. NCHU2750]
MSADDRQLTFAIPGDIETPSGGYGYDRRVMRELLALGWTVDHMVLPGAFPHPAARDIHDVAARFSAIGDDSLVLVDGLAFGAMPQVATAEAARLRLVALVHHPLALETGLTDDLRLGLKNSEKDALKATRGVIVTSSATAHTLTGEFGVNPETILVAVPGTDRPVRIPAEREDRSVQSPLILAVGSLTQRKDHATLISALQMVADRPWQCRIVGSATMSPETAHALRRQVAAYGLSDRIALTGAVNDVAIEFGRANIFALASRYEGYGMVFAEAMSHGLPIVACRGGAVADVVPQTAGMLVDPGDVAAFAQALASLLDNPERRRKFAAGSLQASRSLPDWSLQARAISDFLDTII